MKKQQPDNPDASKKATPTGAQPTPSPATDPTNPHNPESTGDWVAAERAAERRDPEPGITDRERQQRKH